MKTWKALLAVMLIALAVVRPAAAEVKEVRIAQQYGLSYLAFMVMEHNKLLEARAKAAGLGDVNVIWFKFSGGNVMNDALLSGSLDFANSGVPAFLTLWSASRNTLKVRAVAAYNALPNVLIVRNQNVKSIKDLTAADRIALPAVKASNQAILLQMEVEKVFGAGNYAKLDQLTISRSHPDAMAALLQPNGEITAHFSAPPYIALELKQPGMHSILTGEQAIGGPLTSGVAYATSKFHDENPKVYAAFFAALKEAIDFINSNRRGAAEIYLKMSRENNTVEGIVAEMNQLKNPYSLTPQSTLKFAHFMNRTGAIKERAATWQDLFFPEAHTLPGS
jgi:NitT/TauT family transport system substrate-binding protein